MHRDENKNRQDADETRHASLWPDKVNNEYGTKGSRPHVVYEETDDIQPTHVIREEVHNLPRRGFSQSRFTQPQSLKSENQFYIGSDLGVVNW